MRGRWIALIASLVMLAGGATYVVGWTRGLADCTSVDVRPQSWQPTGVVVDVMADCALRSGDVVREVDGRPLTANALAGTWTVGQTLPYLVTRADEPQTVPVTLERPDLLGRLRPAWPTLLFIASLLGVAAYVAGRRPGAATSALLVAGSGLAASTLPTLLGIPVVGLFEPRQHWLHLLLTQPVYLTAWAAMLAFALLFPRPYPLLQTAGRAARWTLFAAPLWITGLWALVAAVDSSTQLDWTGRVIAGATIAVVGTQLGLIALMLHRLRSPADALERQQLRWLVGSGVLALAAGLTGWFLPQLLLGDGLPIEWIGLAALPFVAGLAVAISRHRLFDLDIVLNRSLVYGLLTVTVVAVYLVLVTAATTVLRGSSPTPAAVVATAVVAIAVNPLRVALQRGVDRMMYGDRRDPYSALSRLGRQLDSVSDSEPLLPAVASDIADALRVPYVAITLEPGADPAEAGRRPTWLADEQLLQRTLVDHGVRIGQLLVAPRTPSEAFSPADERLLDDLSRRVGAAARELSLRGDLQRSREQLVLAREEERRRLRRALHDELGPAIAGLGLRTEAARRLLATDPRAASAALATVRDGSADLVADIRRLAYDLRPPALDELGLVGALDQHARAIEAPTVTVSAEADLGELPAAVEAAAYRIAVEALANTVRHAHATACAIRLGRHNAQLELRVVDDGHGMPVDAHAGVGLSAMRERAAELGGDLRVESRAGGGTVVVAALPIGAPVT